MLTEQIVGVLELSSKYRYGLTSRGAPLYLFKPYDETRPDYIVGSTERDTTRNQIAVVDVPAIEDPTPGQKTRGSLIQLLGPVGNIDAERAGLLRHYCNYKHPMTVSAPEPDPTDDENREPIDAANGWITFHIDPAGCRDIDDAIAYHRESRTWAITIADAAAAVPADSPIDVIAENIGATFYDDAGRVVKPMLPSVISEEQASLLPGQRRRGVTLFCGPDGSQRFGLTWITVEHSFTYESFPKSVVAFDLDISRDPHVWIETLMIRYNAAVATRLKAAGCGLLRTQSAADSAAVANWDAIDPSLRFLAAEAARYENVGIGHQGHATLSLSAYCHASSPLRRYADLTNQRILKALLRPASTIIPAPAYSDLADHLNQRMKANRQWTRDLTFLTHVTPGRVHVIDVVWVSLTQVWVPAWKRILRIRHDPVDVPAPGTRAQIEIFCDPTKRNWKQRILTAPISDNSNPPTLAHH